MSAYEDGSPPLVAIGSLFSGVGGCDLGLERAGHCVLWQVEYDKQARSVLRKHWPNVDIYEDVRDVGAGELSPVDLICGGFPCQDLSVAGRRAGLDGDRSGLWFEFHRIVRELRPRWVLIENVPGLRSSDGGRDLAVVVRGLAELGYVGAFRSLDSQYFGVAQRRERIFLLACRDLGDGCPAEVLAIPEGVSGHPAPSREAREVVAGTLGSGANRTGGNRFGRGDLDTSGAYPLANTPPTKYRGDPHEGTDTLVASPVFRKAQKAHNPEDGERWEEAEHSGTLAGHGTTTGEIALAFKPSHYTRGKDGAPNEVMPPLSADADKGDQDPLVMISARGGAQQDEFVGHDGITGALAHSSNSHGGHHQPKVFGGAVPRRLTPIECERLQGFPDNWTRYGVTDEGEEIELADSPRYRMMGNAVTVNVAEWIGRRLAVCEAMGYRSLITTEVTDE